MKSQIILSILANKKSLMDGKKEILFFWLGTMQSPHILVK
jgi:hypothetical protein